MRLLIWKVCHSCFEEKKHYNILGTNIYVLKSEHKIIIPQRKWIMLCIQDVAPLLFSINLYVEKNTNIDLGRSI